MDICTSYFSNARNFPANALLVSIARWKPKWAVVACDVTGTPVFDKIAPTADLLNWYKAEGDKTGYTAKYLQQLQTVNLLSFLYTLEQIHAGRTVVLLCYEKPGDFCHRHILANELNEVIKRNNLEFKYGTVKEL